MKKKMNNWERNEPLHVGYYSSSSKDEVKIKNKEKKLITMTGTITENTSISEFINFVEPLEDPENDLKKKKIQKEQGLVPMTCTNISMKTQTKAKAITFTTPPEDPENEVCIYLCLENNIGYVWSKIDLKDQSLPKSKSKSKSKPILLPIISSMPPTSPPKFHVIASSNSGPFSKKKNKLVYAVGGFEKPYADAGWGCGLRKSSRAFVCDFGSMPLDWKELPQMPSPNLIRVGVVTPSDGKVHVYPLDVEGVVQVTEEVVFDPASWSWNSGTMYFTYGVRLSGVDDYTFDREKNELILFTGRVDRVITFNLTALSLKANLVDEPGIPVSESAAASSSVVVGNIVYKYSLGELYALDRSSESFSFKLVPGLSDHGALYNSEWYFVASSYLFYIGKGKFALVCGYKDTRFFISCHTFWVGICSQTNSPRVIIDQHEEYVADGNWLCHCIAL